MFFSYSWIAFAFILFSCAAMEDNYRTEMCSRDKGYELGVNDGMEGKPMNSSFASVCEPSIRREVSMGYREGYETAKKQNDSLDGGDQIVVQVPGVDIRMGQGKQKSWVCEVKAFGTTYSGFGPTRGQASQDARNKCAKSRNAIHCDNVACQQDK